MGSMQINQKRPEPEGWGNPGSGMKNPSGDAGIKKPGGGQNARRGSQALNMGCDLGALVLALTLLTVCVVFGWVR